VETAGTVRYHFGERFAGLPREVEAGSGAINVLHD
jgi:hypothetical protein